MTTVGQDEDQDLISMRLKLVVKGSIAALLVILAMKKDRSY
jgi:hypothetical protein